MDVSDFDSSDINVFLARSVNKGLKKNKDCNVVLIHVFIGSVFSEQQTPLSVALSVVKKHYLTRGIQLRVTIITNDFVRNILHWTCTELFTWLVSADIHLLPTHLHQGMMGLGGMGTWNIPNILKNFERLRYHLGTPCGKFVDCPITTQNKMEYYRVLQTVGLCAPTISVDISGQSISPEDTNKIIGFVAHISASELFNNPHPTNNESQFVIKLPFSTNSQRIKRGAGVMGIQQAIVEFMRDESVWGYIPSALVQPEIRENAEVKIICFDGKAYFRNTIKKSKDGRSPFGRGRDKAYFEFAEHVIANFKRLCPSAIADQVIRVDAFGFRHLPGVFIVNELEGYESAKWGSGPRAGDHVAKVLMLTEDYWIKLVMKLVDYHLNVVQ